MQRLTLALIVCAAAACGGDKPATTDKPPAVSANPGADEFRKQQQAYADSVLNSVSSAKDVAKRLGSNYDVGSIKMRDSLAALVTKADCFAIGRKLDPYLAGTVTLWVNMSIIGTDVIRVQEGTWTSPAGKAVEGCINGHAQKWQLDASFGPPKAYLIQIQFK